MDVQVDIFFKNCLSERDMRWLTCLFLPFCVLVFDGTLNYLRYFHSNLLAYEDCHVCVENALCVNMVYCERSYLHPNDYLLISLVVQICGHLIDNSIKPIGISLMKTHWKSLILLIVSNPICVLYDGFFH